jgi:hypothetical protein
MTPLCGTFDYQAIVPEARSEGGFECYAKTRRPVVRSGSHLEGDRLVGMSPRVCVTDAGPPSTPGLRPPWSLRKRSRIALVAIAQDRASVAEASFHIDKTFTDCAKAGDHMHLSGDGGCGLAFSLIRGGKLVAAAGALTLVPLGNGAEVRIPKDLISAAASVFQKRDPGFEFVERPVEVKIEGLREWYGQSRSGGLQNSPTDAFISFGGGETIGDYRVIVRHGSFAREGGQSESLSICDKQMFTHAAAEFAAMLLDDCEAFSISQWPGDRR